MVPTLPVENTDPFDITMSAPITEDDVLQHLVPISTDSTFNVSVERVDGVLYIKAPGNVADKALYAVSIVDNVVIRCNWVGYTQYMPRVASVSWV